jgi:hypothetical protein
MNSFWTTIQGDSLEQGDYMPACWVPVIGSDFDPAIAQPEISVGRGNLIIVTQSCDLANDKIQLAALCPIADLATWEQLNSDYAKRGFWESVRQGRSEGLHMLSAFADASDARNALVADFRQIFSLPVYLACPSPICGDMRRGLGRGGGCTPRSANISLRRLRASSCASGFRRQFRRSNDAGRLGRTQSAFPPHCGIQEYE